MKAYSSWNSQNRIQQLREMMGGFGYSKFTKIGAIRDNNDVVATWEGANQILIQQGAKYLLDAFKNKMNGIDAKEDVTIIFL